MNNTRRVYMPEKLDEELRAEIEKSLKSKDINLEPSTIASLMTAATKEAVDSCYEEIIKKIPEMKDKETECKQFLDTIYNLNKTEEERNNAQMGLKILLLIPLKGDILENDAILSTISLFSYQQSGKEEQTLIRKKIKADIITAFFNHDSIQTKLIEKAKAALEIAVSNYFKIDKLSEVVIKELWNWASPNNSMLNNSILDPLNINVLALWARNRAFENARSKFSTIGNNFTDQDKEKIKDLLTGIYNLESTDAEIERCRIELKKFLEEEKKISSERLNKESLFTRSVEGIRTFINKEAVNEIEKIATYLKNVVKPSVAQTNGTPKITTTTSPQIPTPPTVSPKQTATQPQAASLTSTSNSYAAALQEYHDKFNTPLLSNMHLGEYIQYLGRKNPKLFVPEGTDAFRMCSLKEMSEAGKINDLILSRLKAYDDTNTDPIKKTIFAFPIRVSESHWTLLIIDREKRLIEYYDSYFPGWNDGNTINDASVRKHFSDFSKQLSAQEKDKQPYVFDNKIKEKLQTNTYDCGPWVLNFLEKRLENPNVSFTPSTMPDMSAYRKTMATNLANTQSASTVTASMPQSISPTAKSTMDQMEMKFRERDKQLQELDLDKFPHVKKIIEAIKSLHARYSEDEKTILEKIISKPPENLLNNGNIILSANQAALQQSLDTQFRIIEKLREARAKASPPQNVNEEEIKRIRENVRVIYTLDSSDEAIKKSAGELNKIVTDYKLENVNIKFANSVEKIREEVQAEIIFALKNSVSTEIQHIRQLPKTHPAIDPISTTPLTLTANTTPKPADPTLEEVKEEKDLEEAEPEEESEPVLPLSLIHI